MKKCHISHPGYATAVAALGVALAGLPGIVFAGPGCMSDQRMSRWGHPHGPMLPPAAYIQPVPNPYYAVPSPYPYPGRMAAPYAGPMYAGQDASVKSRPDVASNTGQTSGTAAGSDSSTSVESITVRINGMRFEPENITVKPGTQVTWVHGGRMPHTVTGNVDGPRSGTLYNGQQYSHTFGDKGLYTYSCSLHPSMTGRVTVEDAGKDG